MDVTVTLKGPFNGGAVDVEVREHDSGGAVINTAQKRFGANSAIQSLSGFAGQDGTRSYSTHLTLRSADPTRSPEVRAVALDVPNLDYYGKWRFDGTVLYGHVGPEETHTPGESYTLEVYLPGAIDSPDAAWPDALARYDDLREYQQHAGDYDTYESIGGRVYFREQHNTSPSMLVAVRPPANAGDGCGLGGYYLIEAVTDKTTLPESVVLMDFDLLYVAGLDEYANADAVRRDLGDRSQ